MTNMANTYRDIITVHRLLCDLKAHAYVTERRLKELAAQIPHELVEEYVYVTTGGVSYELFFDNETGFIISVTEIELVSLDTE